MQRIHDASGGNPLFGLELARALQRRGGVIDPGRPLPVPPTLRAAVSQRLDALPLRVRQALACAAALAQPTVSSVGDKGALELGVEAGMIEIERGRVRFVHPLIASAAYESVGDVERSRLHRRLSESADDPEEAARHLALAADGPDGVVASTLEDAASRAAARGAPGAAAELAELAHGLTPEQDSDGSARRAIDAGWYRFVAGDAERARALLEGAREAAPPGVSRARAILRLAWLDHHAFDRRRAPDLYRAALAEAGDDPLLQAEVHSLLAWCLLIMRADIHLALQHAREAVELCEQLDDQVLLVDSLAIEAQSEFLLGGGLPSRAMERALGIQPDTPDPRELRQPLQHWAVVLFWADRLDESRTLMTQVLERASAHGDESALAWPLMRLCHIELMAGDWAKAAEHAEAGYAAALETGQRPLQADMLCSRALVLAHLGRADESRDTATEGIELAERWGAGIGRRLAAWSLGMLDLSLGRADEAFVRLDALRAESQANGIVDPGENRFIGDLGEAMVITGRVAEAERLSDDLHALGTALERPSALAAALRIRGLALAARGEGPAAIAAFERALPFHERPSMPLERARTLLVLGAARRRLGQRRVARQVLGEALAIFERLGATTWAANARTEMGRIGGRAPSSGDLTPTERRIAELVAEGKTNKEVAAILVVADRTIESALTQIYRKLEVRSRTELARKLGSTA
jgi:DNA-binding CsgD family transcriptional regulator